MTSLGAFGRVIVALCLVATLVAACGGGGQPAAGQASATAAPAQGAASGQALSACTVLTKADADAVLGGSVDAPTPKVQEQKGGAWSSTCTYFAASTAQGAALVLTYTPKADPAKALTAYTDSLKKALGDAYKPETVAGLGDGALWDAASKQLTVFKGAYMLVLTMSGAKLDAAAALAGAKTLAGNALARLP